jgi:hypothetical protein
MSGALVQLVATGPQDKWLTADPEISLFESVYSRYEIFSIESIQQTISGTADFGRHWSVEIDRSGDLLVDMMLEMTVPAVTITGTNPGFQWAPNLAQTILQKAEFKIGGLSIDTHYGDFYHAYVPLTIDESKKRGYNELIGQQVTQENASNPANIIYSYSGLQTYATSQPATKLYMPLQFWFTKNPGLAFPLSAVLFNPVKVEFDFRTATQCYKTTGTGLSITSGNVQLADCQMYVDYVFLPNNIRDRFVNECHNYLVHQLQVNNQNGDTFTGSNAAVKINFNHPTKELIYVVREQAAETDVQWNNFETYNAAGPAGAAGLEPVSICKLTVSGRDRFSQRSGPYFTRYNPYKYHTAVPYQKGIGVIPLGLGLEDWVQPQGSLNFTRVENATLQLTLVNASAANPVNVIVWGLNFNFLKVERGVAGLIYAA